MSLKNFAVAGAVGLATASAGVFMHMPAAQAACLTTTPEVPTPDNNCRTYDNAASPTIATLHFSDTKFSTNSKYQLAGNATTFANFSDWAYSQDGTNFTSFTPTLTNSGGFTLSQVYTLTPIGNPYFLRVALSPTATLATDYNFTLYSNSDGAIDSDGILKNNAGNNDYTALTRTFKRVGDSTAPVPGPLPLVGAFAAFSYSRKIRSAIRKAG
jgi:hypothetical protein